MSEEDWGEIVPEDDKVLKKQKYMHKADYGSVAELKNKVANILHPEAEITEAEEKIVLIDPEIQRKNDLKKKLERLRDKTKKQFPKLKIKETPESVAFIRDNEKCLSCRFYVTQCSIPKVKNKIRKTGVAGWEEVSIRMYRNKAEALEDSRGICAIPISMSRHTKFVVNRPDLSLCSDYQIHHDLETYFDALGKMFAQEKDTRDKKLREIAEDKQRKEKAMKIIDDLNQKYRIGMTGRKSKDTKIYLNER